MWIILNKNIKTNLETRKSLLIFDNIKEQNKLIAYKLFRVLKNGEISPLFINKTQRLPLNQWLIAESHPTKGYSYRPFWHCTSQPVAPHLSMKGRKWFKIEINDFEQYNRPNSQGGIWYLAKNIKILEEI